MRTLRLLLFPIALLLLGSGPVADCELLPQEVVRRLVTVRTTILSEAAPEADSVGLLKPGDLPAVLSCADGWCNVRFALMRGFVPDSILAEPVATPTPTTRPAPAPAPRRTCCRICRTGKACGNSCINRSYTCRRPPGCACNG